MKTTSYGKNLTLVLSFIAGVIGLIVIVLVWRISILIAQSKVDDTHQFIVAIKNPTKKIVAFMPETKSISILILKQGINKDAIGKELEIPIDASIQGNGDESLSQIFWKSMFTFNREDTINVVDKIKLWLYLQSIHADTISQESVQPPLSEDTYTNTIQKLFTDKSLYQEAKTIHIINATGLSGFGNRLARLLTNIGGNVIMVDTGAILPASSIAYTDSLSYSQKRMQQILHMPLTVTNIKPVIADIIITIGKDEINTKAF